MSKSELHSERALRHPEIVSFQHYLGSDRMFCSTDAAALILSSYVNFG